MASEARRREHISVGRRGAVQPPGGKVQRSRGEEWHCSLHSVPRSAVTGEFAETDQLGPPSWSTERSGG